MEAPGAPGEGRGRGGRRRRVGVESMTSTEGRVVQPMVRLETRLQREEGRGRPERRRGLRVVVVVTHAAVVERIKAMRSSAERRPSRLRLGSLREASPSPNWRRKRVRMELRGGVLPGRRPAVLMRLCQQRGMAISQRPSQSLLISSFPTIPCRTSSQASRSSKLDQFHRLHRLPTGSSCPNLSRSLHRHRGCRPILTLATPPLLHRHRRHRIFPLALRIPPFPLLPPHPQTEEARRQTGYVL